MKKCLYIDLETTGLNSEEHSIVQLAGLIVIDGNLKEEFNYFMQPANWENISKKSLEINSLTIDLLKTFQPYQQAYKQFVEVLGKYVDKYDKEDKFFPVGYNIAIYDLPFLQKFFEMNNDQYLGSWINWKTIDVLTLVNYYELRSLITPENRKLETVCKSMGIPILAHDALSDIRATRELLKRLVKLG